MCYLDKYEPIPEKCMVEPVQTNVVLQGLSTAQWYAEETDRDNHRIYEENSIQCQLPHTSNADTARSARWHCRT